MKVKVKKFRRKQFYSNAFRGVILFLSSYVDQLKISKNNIKKAFVVTF